MLTSSENASANSIVKMDTAKEDEDMRTALVSVIEADERVKLIKAAIKAGVGFAEIEYFNLKQAQHCKGGERLQ